MITANLYVPFLQKKTKCLLHAECRREKWNIINIHIYATYFRKHISKLRQICCAYYLWSWLCSPLAALLTV